MGSTDVSARRRGPRFSSVPIATVHTTGTDYRGGITRLTARPRGPIGRGKPLKRVQVSVRARPGVQVRASLWSRPGAGRSRSEREPVALRRLALDHPPLRDLIVGNVQ